MSVRLYGKGLAIALEAAAIIASAALLALMLGLVLTRYVLGWSVVGLDELALLSAIWLYMLGGVIASRRNEHLVVDFVPQRLVTERAKAVHGIVVSVISVAILCLFVYWSYRLIAWGIRLPQTSASLSLSLLIPQSAIMFGSIGCLGYAVRDLVKSISALRASPLPGPLSPVP